MIDLQAVRRETPGVIQVNHLNNAGAALMPRSVLETVKAHLDLESSIGGYEAARLEGVRLQAVYSDIARLIGANDDEIAIVENATRAWDMAFYGISFRAGERILISRAEYASNAIACLQVAARSGAVVEVIPSDDSGALDVEALERMMDARVRVIAVTHVPTNGGLVNPAAAIGRIARTHGVLYLLDACQSVGQMPIDVAEIGCDILSATSRKYLRGPRGVGFLYVRKAILSILEPPMLDLHAARWITPERYELDPTAKRFENWEANLAARLGLGQAVRYALQLGLEPIWARVHSLGERLRALLREVPGVQVHDLGHQRCGIVSFTVDGLNADDVRTFLLERAINVNVSRAGSTLMDMSVRRLSELVRASVHYYNSEDELEGLQMALKEAIGSRRIPSRA